MTCKSSQIGKIRPRRNCFGKNGLLKTSHLGCRAGTLRMFLFCGFCKESETGLLNQKSQPNWME